MTDLSVTERLRPYKATHKVRCFVTAASLFDGHDASINIEYMVDRLRQNGGGDIKVFGGGGVIVPREIRELHEYRVAPIYSPEDGAVPGLQGMINDLIAQSDFDRSAGAPQGADLVPALRSGNRRQLARTIIAREDGVYDEPVKRLLREAAAVAKPQPS